MNFFVMQGKNMNRLDKLKPVVLSWVFLIFILFFMAARASAQEVNPLPSEERAACVPAETGDSTCEKHITYASPVCPIAYEESGRACYLAPVVALGTFSIAGI